MKRTLCILLGAVMLLLSFAACSASEASEMVHEEIQAKTVSFETLEEMEKFSDLIVVGVRMKAEDSDLIYSEGYSIGGYTFSEFKITGIFKDNTNSYKENDAVTILENEFYNQSEKKTYHLDGYNMMVEGKEYLLFLDKAHYKGRDYFVASGVNFGTISLEDDNRMSVLYSIDGTTKEPLDYSYFEPIWKAAREKYIQPTQ